MTSRTAIILCTTLTLAGCADKRDATEASPSKSIAPAASAMAVDGALTRDKSDGAESHDGDEAGEGKTPVERKLIQTAELHVSVRSYAAARHEIEKQLSEMGGFIANATVQHNDGQVSRADLVIRVPSDQLDDFLAGTAGHGDVTHEAVNAQDITEGYYDTKARLKNAQRLEARLLTLVDKNADTVTGLLEVERELARVRGQIEGFEGQLRLWDNRVSLSTVTLRLVTEQVYAVTAPTPPPTMLERMRGSLEGSIAALKAAGLSLLLVMIALLPWLVPTAVVGYGLRWVARRVRKRRPLQPRATAAVGQDG